MSSTTNDGLLHQRSHPGMKQPSSPSDHSFGWSSGLGFRWLRGTGVLIMGSNPVAPTVFQRSPSASTSNGFFIVGTRVAARRSCSIGAARRADVPTDLTQFVSPLHDEQFKSHRQFWAVDRRALRLEGSAEVLDQHDVAAALIILDVKKPLLVG